jgi:hypothetical protein
MQELELKSEKKIVITDALSLKKWSAILNCEQADLIKALSAIGNSFRAVDDYLILNRQKLS